MRVIINAWRDLAHPQAGGSEVVIDVAATELTRRGHDVTLVAGGPVGERPYPVVASGGTYDHFVRTPLVHRRLPDADVVVDTSSGMTYFAPAWSRRPVVMVATHVHTEQWGQMFPRPVAAAGRLLEGRVAPFAYRNSLVLAPSPSTREGLVGLGYPAENIRLFNNPVRVVESAVSRSATPRFVALGRLVPYKRIDVLFEMWERVRPVTGGELVVIGDGPDRARLERLRPNGARLTGFVSEQEKADLIASAWLLLHPSHHEGWGISITEAGHFGVPSLGFDVDGVRDAVIDGESGRLASDADDFVAAWLDLAGDSAELERLGARARSVAREHDADGVSDAFERVLEEAISRRSRP